MTSPEPKTSVADSLCRRVLSTVRSVDSKASITSVAKWESDDSTLVRLKTSTGSVMTAIQAALRLAYPLASISIVENVIDGTNEAQILLPSKTEQEWIARDKALQIPRVKRLSQLTSVIGFGATIAFLIAFVAALSVST